MYPFERALKNDCTVKEWIDTRFNPSYPGFEVDVLDGSGEAIKSKNTKLGTVRDTYIEE